jgi:hypothetical protein
MGNTMILSIGIGTLQTKRANVNAVIAISKSIVGRQIPAM